MSNLLKMIGFTGFAQHAAMMALLMAGMVLSGMSASTMRKAVLCIEINDCPDCQIPGNPA
jgi:hypothetical protein